MICPVCRGEMQRDGNNFVCVVCGEELILKHNDAQPKKITNADRIRNMTDEELAGFIAPCDCLDCPLNNEETWCSATEKGCRDSILAWLKQEVDG